MIWYNGMIFVGRSSNFADLPLFRGSATRDNDREDYAEQLHYSPSFSAQLLRVVWSVRTFARVFFSSTPCENQRLRKPSVREPPTREDDAPRCDPLYLLSARSTGHEHDLVMWEHNRIKISRHGMPGSAPTETNQAKPFVKVLHNLQPFIGHKPKISKRWRPRDTDNAPIRLNGPVFPAGSAGSDVTKCVLSWCRNLLHAEVIRGGQCEPARETSLTFYWDGHGGSALIPLTDLAPTLVSIIDQSINQWVDQPFQFQFQFFLPTVTLTVIHK